VLFGSAEVNLQDLESICQTGIEFLKYEVVPHPGST